MPRGGARPATGHGRPACDNMPQPRRERWGATFIVMRIFRHAALVLLLALSLSSTVHAEDTAPAATEPARELERRLLAPCCWRETLDVHESQPAAELRREIRRRVAAGEGSASIEADLVARHGSKIRATLPGSLGTYLFAVIFFCGLFGAALFLFRKERRTAAQGPAPGDARGELPDEERRRLEDRLDEDLESEL